VIVDTSAILAILFEEDDAELYARALIGADSSRISAATFMEAGVVVDIQTEERGSRQFDAFLRRSCITIEPVSEEQAHVCATTLRMAAPLSLRRRLFPIEHAGHQYVIQPLTAEVRETEIWRNWHLTA
jgi:predicted nucleic acid-binding protein